MKIYKNDAYVTLELDEFLELLEEDALDEIIYMIMDLDEYGSIKQDEGDVDGDYGITYATVYYTDGMDMDEILSMFGENATYSVISEEELDSVFGATGDNHGFINEEELMDSLLLSNEDLRVRKIVDRFRHLLDE